MISRSEERGNDRERSAERKQGGQDGGIHERCRPGRSEASARWPTLNCRCGAGPIGKGQKPNVHVRHRQRPPRHGESPGPRQTAQGRLRSWPLRRQEPCESGRRPMTVRMVSSCGAASIHSVEHFVNEWTQRAKHSWCSTEEHAGFQKSRSTRQSRHAKACLARARPQRTQPEHTMSFSTSCWCVE